MNFTTFKTKLLLILSNINKEKPKKSIVSMVLFIFLGVLGIVIILSSFLSESARGNDCARIDPNEAKNYIGTILRSQKSYRLKNKSFALTLTDLKISLPTQVAKYSNQIITNSYSYGIISSSNEKSTSVMAVTLYPFILRSYSGQIVINNKNDMKAIICETIFPSGMPPIPDAANQKCINGERIK